jgi:hypothetical protein
VSVVNRDKIVYRTEKKKLFQTLLDQKYIPLSISAKYSLLWRQYCRAYVSTIIRRVLDWQLDLLDHAQLHTITVHILHNSLLQLQLFSEDCCSARILTRNWSCPRHYLVTNSTLSTNSYGVPCHYSLTSHHQLVTAPPSNTKWPGSLKTLVI